MPEQDDNLVIASQGTAFNAAQVLESITDAFFALDTHWRFTYLNAQAERLLARTRANLLGKSVWDEFPAAVGSAFEREYRRAREEQVAVTFEEYYPPPLDTWFEVRTYPSPDGVSVYFRDITERKQVEQERARSAESLRQSEERYRLLADGLEMGIWHMDVSTGVTTFSPRMAELYLLSRDALDAPFGALLDGVHPDDRTLVQQTVERSINEITPVNIEHRVVGNGSQVRWIEGHGRTYAGADGQPSHFEGIAFDITERVERERRERFLAELAERARTLTDPEEVIADALRSAGEFLGVSRCLFADIDIQADICTVRPDYLAGEDVASMAGAFPISAFGPYLVGEYGAGHTVVADDVHIDPERFPSEYVVSYDAVACRAFVAVPVLHSSRLVSVLAAHSPTPRQWTPGEVALLQTVVERTWLTVEVTRQERAVAREAEERRAAHERTAVILESIGDAFYALDDQWRFSYVNRQTETLWGRRREEFLGQSFLKMLPQLAGSFSLAQHERVLAERVPAFYETLSPILGRWAEVSIYPTADGGLSVFFRDINERKELELEREHLAERERNISHQLQAALQTELPGRVPGLALAKYYEAALAESEGVGGDFYDVFSIENGSTVIAVGDLSGKGLAAAAQVATVRNMLRAFVYTRPILAEAVTELNAVLAENGLLTGFATLFVAAYDAGTCALRYVNCGQEPALLRHSATGQVEQLPPTGSILGSFEGALFEERTVELAPGDALSAFTDGLTEIGPSRREMLGIEGVAQLLASAVIPDKADSAEAVAEYLSLHLIAGVDAAAEGGVMRDDICLLMAVVEGDSPGLAFKPM